MKQIARTKFTSFGLRVPTNWKQPQGEAGDMYTRAFKPEHRNTAPAMGALFQAATPNKHHTDTQKNLHEQFGGFIDGTVDALCSAWSQWQSSATLVGVVITGFAAMGGQVVGPPLQPMILASAPKKSPTQAQFSNIIATVISTAWMTYTGTIKVSGLPWYPAFVAVPSPVAPPTPNVPCPVATLTQVDTVFQSMKTQMVGMLGDPRVPFHQELFESICFAFIQCYTVWKTSTMVTNVLGMGPVPTFAPPYVPVGPVVGGVGNMMPGGFT